MWHQEYPAQLRSIDGLVFWSPLVPLAEELGPVMFCPGSQVEGPLPVCEADPENVGRTGAYSLLLHNESEYLSKYKQIAPLTKPRDLVVIDFLVLHASGYNRGDRARWSMQFRYFNFKEPIGRSHGWMGSYAAGVDFRDIHPELLIK
jgi:Protein involved in biosynthesis of mitomycin antibiotics/polyketide fumonisin